MTIASSSASSPSATTSTAWPSVRRPRATAAASLASSSTTSRRISASTERNQFKALRAAADRRLGELADPARVPLAVAHARLQPRPLGRLQDVAVEGTKRHGDARPAREDAKAILGHARVALLQERPAAARMRRHVDARPRAVAAGLPGPFGADDMAMAIELGGRLAVVADGAAAVGGVPVRGALDQ